MIHVIRAAPQAAVEDTPPAVEDPDACFDGLPFIQEEHDEEWEEWCTWGAL